MSCLSSTSTVPQQPGRPATTPRGALLPRAQAPVQASPVTLSWQGPTQVRSGDKLNLVLNVNSAQPMNQLDLLVSFDPDVFKAVDVIDGGFLRQGNTPSILTKNIDQSSGQIQLDVSATGPDGASGTGNLVTLVLEAIAPNPDSQIVVGRLAPSGPGGEALPATAPNPHVIKVMP